MTQNVLRTMQDDIKEVKKKLQEKNTSDNFVGKNKNVLHKDKSISTEKKDTSLEIKQDTAEKKDNPKKTENTKGQNENKPDNFSEVIKKTEETKKQDEELKNLTQRIHSSMNSVSIPVKPKDEGDIPNKDRELKNLIGRISNNINKETNLEEKSKKEIEKTEIIKNTPEELQKESVSKKEDKNKEEKNKKESEQKKETPYWEKLHKAIKSKNKETKKEEIEKEMDGNKEGIKEIKEKIKEEYVKPEVIKEEEEKTQLGGIIKPLTSEEEKEEIVETEEKISVAKLPSYYNDYISPENRLIFGKQEYYSSIHKKIKPKTKKENLEQFKNMMKETEKLITDEEEKKMLKKQIAKKYGINLSSLPWKKIVIVSVILLTVWAGAWAYILPKIKNSPEETTIISEGENIEFVNEKISYEIVATKSEVAGINYFDAALAPWNNFTNGDVLRLNIISNETDKILEKDEVLALLLGDVNYSNIPEDFMDITSQKYNLIVFKNNNSIRLGLALEFKEGSNAREKMLEWEHTNNKTQRIQNIMRALFVSDKTSDTEQNFSSTQYEDIEIRYLNLPDTETSMDYFIYNNIVIFTTSKDSTAQIINILK